MAFKVSIPPLKIEPHNETVCWERFKKRFEIASIGVDFCKGLEAADSVPARKRVKKAESQRRAAAMLNVVGEEGTEIFFTFNVEVEELQYPDLVRRFTDYFKGRENVTILRHRFLTMEQGGEETNQQFITRARAAGGRCQLGGAQEDMVVHVVIKGLRDEKLKTELLQQSEVNLYVLTNICAKYESAERTLEELGRRNMRGEVSGVCEREEVRGAVAVVDRQGESKRQAMSGVECYRCRGRGHFQRDCTRPAKCNVCRQDGHMAANCWKRQGNGRGKPLFAPQRKGAAAAVVEEGVVGGMNALWSDPRRVLSEGEESL